MANFKLRVIAPCAQSWTGMAGDDHARHCASCSLTVHNLSAMAAKEARRLIAESEGRLCVRFLHRRDGTVVWRPRGRWIGRVARALALAALAVAFWTGIVLVQRPWQAVARRLAGVPPPEPRSKTTAPARKFPSVFPDDYLRQLWEQQPTFLAGGYEQAMGEIRATGRLSDLAPLLPQQTTKHRRPK